MPLNMSMQPTLFGTNQRRLRYHLALPQQLDTRSESTNASNLLDTRYLLCYCNGQQVYNSTRLRSPLSDIPDAIIHRAKDFYSYPIQRTDCLQLRYTSFKSLTHLNLTFNSCIEITSYKGSHRITAQRTSTLATAEAQIQ